MYIPERKQPASNQILRATRRLALTAATVALLGAMLNAVGAADRWYGIEIVSSMHDETLPIC
jgi:hypothetical protein